jgi:hypothetical protein
LELPKLLRALLYAALAIGWSALSGWMLRGSPLAHNWIGVVFVYGPTIALLALFVINLIRGLRINAERY